MAGRVRRGFLQHEAEHKRIGANVWQRVWAETGKGQLSLWLATDVEQPGVTPAADAIRTLDLTGAQVGATKSSRKEFPHSFRVTLSFAGVARGGAAGQQKHVLAAASAEELAEWVAALQANVELLELPEEEREQLIADDERAAEAEQLQERLSTLAALCAGLCGHVCRLCGRCLPADRSQQDADAAGGGAARRRYHPVTPKGSRTSGDGDDADAGEWEEVAGGGPAAAAGEPIGDYISQKRQAVRETAEVSSTIVRFVEKGERLTCFEIAIGGGGHKRLRLQDGWISSGGGAIDDRGKPAFEYVVPA